MNLPRRLYCPYPRARRTSGGRLTRLAVLSESRILLFDARRPEQPICCLDPPGGDGFCDGAQLPSARDNCFAFATRKGLFLVSSEGHELRGEPELWQGTRSIAVHHSLGRTRLIALSADRNLRVVDRQLRQRWQAPLPTDVTRLALGPFERGYCVAALARAESDVPIWDASGPREYQDGPRAVLTQTHGPATSLLAHATHPGSWLVGTASGWLCWYEPVRLCGWVRPTWTTALAAEPVQGLTVVAGSELVSPTFLATTPRDIWRITPASRSAYRFVSLPGPARSITAWYDATDLMVAVVGQRAVWFGTSSSLAPLDLNALEGAEPLAVCGLSATD